MDRKRKVHEFVNLYDSSYDRIELNVVFVEHHRHIALN